MGMPDFHPVDHNADFLTGESFLNGLCDFFCEDHQPAQQIVVQIENIIDFLFWDDQGMSRMNRLHLQKSEIFLIFQDFVAGNFPVEDSREYRAHVFSFFVAKGLILKLPERRLCSSTEIFYHRKGKPVLWRNFHFPPLRMIG